MEEAYKAAVAVVGQKPDAIRGRHLTWYKRVTSERLTEIREALREHGTVRMYLGCRNFPTMIQMEVKRG